MTDSVRLVRSIRSGLQEIADPSIAVGQQAYMKSTMPFLGVRVPAVRTAVRTLSKEISDAGVLADTALTLWREASHREERYAALAVMALRPLRGDLTQLAVHEEMIRTGAWWDLVDEAAHRLRDLFATDAAVMAIEMRVWADDPDFWVRRAAIISQIGRRLDTDRDVLAYAIEASIPDSEFFIRKAIGWALRELGKHDPHWVREFVAQHSELSPLSQREALKNLG